TSEYHQADDLRTKRKKQAEIAKQANETELFHFAESEFAEYNDRANRMQTARENAIEQIEELEKNYKEMNHKLDRKSTRLNSSHVSISYAVFCLKKKKKKTEKQTSRELASDTQQHCI